MKKIEPKTLKGFRDFLPKEAKKRQYVINILKQVFESYGFEPLETPALEYEEILLGKYGEEGDKLIYRFADNGGRKVALRYDQTVPLARVVAQYQNELPMPFKRYQIQNVWRAENTQKGRYREFLQCDIDTVGTSSLFAEAEIIVCALKCVKKLGFKDYQMLVNDRKILAGLDEEFVRILDKTDKIGEGGVLELLNKTLPNSKKAQEEYGSLKNSKPTDDVNTVFNLVGLIDKKLKDKLFYYPWGLARGLDYYTGIIFELRVTGFGKLSIGGGGRYDDLIGIFAGRQIPATGFAFGFDRLIEAMEQLNLFPEDLVSTKVLITIFSPELKEKSFKVVSVVRAKGINTEMFLDENVSLEKQLKYADQKGIPYVLIIGPDEASKNLVTLRNMKTREQKTIPQTQIITELNSL